MFCDIQVVDLFLDVLIYRYITWILGQLPLISYSGAYMAVSKFMKDMTAMPVVINDPYLTLQEDPLYNKDKDRERIC